jgi:hypothetical protein
MPKLPTVPAIALAVAIAAAGLFFPAFMNAIGFDKFDRHNSAGQAAYLANMVQMTKLAFRNEGRADLADQVDNLFTTTEEGDTSPLGIAELTRNLARARVADYKRLNQDPPGAAPSGGRRALRHPQEEQHFHRRDAERRAATHLRIS